MTIHEIHIEDIEEILALVNKQANIEGLWFRPDYAAEAMLQDELRKLHKLIEDKLGIN